jgi:rare lipoprotein A (peptidoglycan hydrolase)
MLVAIPPAQPAVPLAQVAIVEKVPTRPHGALRLTGPRGVVRLARSRGAGRAGNAIRRAGHRETYRPAQASWYGGGGSLACGGTLTSSTLGVANKTLPCGTWIVLRYRGHKVEVPVIDRGPYVAGREFDLTEATKRALDFGDLGEVWWRLR